MSSALSLSQEQQQLLDNRVLPKGWIRQNPSFNPSPFPYFNSYTSPAWTNGLQGRGLVDTGPLRYSNQFTSALVQPPNPMHQIPQAGRGMIAQDKKEPVLDMKNPFTKKKSKRILYSN